DVEDRRRVDGGVHQAGVLGGDDRLGHGLARGVVLLLDLGRDGLGRAQRLHRGRRGRLLGRVLAVGRGLVLRLAGVLVLGLVGLALGGGRRGLGAFLLLVLG